MNKFIAYTWLLIAANCLFLLGMYSVGYVSKFNIPTCGEVVFTIILLFASLIIGFEFHGKSKINNK